MTAAFASLPDSELEPQLDALQKAAIAVGGATAVSGLGLIAAPRLVLCVLGAGRSDPAPFLFRIIGMFMAVSGGLLADAALAPRTARVALRWALASKIGAAIAVWCGVRTKRFGKQAVALAAFDASAAGLVAALMLRDA